MYIVMYRDRYNNKRDTINCIFTDKQLALEQYFPFGIDKKGRCLHTIENHTEKEYQGFYLIEIDENRSSFITSLLDETIVNYLFENEW